MRTEHATAVDDRVFGGDHLLVEEILDPSQEVVMIVLAMLLVFLQIDGIDAVGE